jgi:hypothetical protein
VTEPARPADPNAALRAELRAQRLRSPTGAPLHITTEVAGSVFTRFLTKYPDAVPEIIAMDLIRRVDQWDEVTAILSVLHGLLTSTTEEGTRRG